MKIRILIILVGKLSMYINLLKNKVFTLMLVNLLKCLPSAICILLGALIELLAILT